MATSSATPISTVLSATDYSGFENGPLKEFTYTRIAPGATVGSMGTDPATLVPSPATAGNYAQPVVLEFSSATDAGYPGNQLLVVDMTALRQAGSDLVKGFTIAGNRDSGGGIEVRSYAKQLDGSYATVGTLVPCRVDYVKGYTPFTVVEAPGSVKVRLSLTPATLVAGRALWTPGAKIVVDVQPILPTKVVQY